MFPAKCAATFLDRSATQFLEKVARVFHVKTARVFHAKWPGNSARVFQANNATLFLDSNVNPFLDRSVLMFLNRAVPTCHVSSANLCQDKFATRFQGNSARQLFQFTQEASRIPPHFLCDRKSSGCFYVTYCCCCYLCSF